jgi:integrase
MAPRNRRGRGYIEPLPSGSFRAVVPCGMDVLTGQRRNLRETAATYPEAEVALTKLQRQVDENKHPKSAITVAEAIERWLEVAKLEETTRDRYEDLIRLYILPTFGTLQAGKIDAELLERFYARLERCRALCKGRPPKGHACRPLSTSTTRKIHFIIRGAFGLAVRWNYLSVNPAELAKSPSPAKTEPDPPSAAEAATLLNDAWTDPAWGLMLWLVMVTGCRRGELCALRWRHLDTERCQLWVQRSTAQPKSGITEKDTKAGGLRRVGLDPYTMELLAKLRERMATQLAALGCTLTEDAFLFSGAPDCSAPLPPRSVTKRYARMAKRLKLRSTRLHSLRHYSATELIAAGVDLRTVAGRLGHGGGGTTTLKTYAAWVQAADRKAADTMADLMHRPVPTPKRPRGPYENIAQALRDDIISGRLQPGDELPTVVQLAAQFTVAAGTAHRAMAVLHAEGLISVTRGKRARVAPPREPATADS